MPQAPKPPPGAGAVRLAALLRQRALEAGVTQTALAASTGISQQQISVLFLGRKAIDVDQLQLICDELGLDVRDVVRRAYAEGS